MLYHRRQVDKGEVNLWHLEAIPNWSQ